MGRVCSSCGKDRNAYMILVGKPEEKRPLGRPSRRWKNYNKMDHTETELSVTK